MADLQQCLPGIPADVIGRILRQAKMSDRGIAETTIVAVPREQMRALWFGKEWLEVARLHPTGLTPRTWAIGECAEFLDALVIIAKAQPNDEKSFVFDAQEIIILKCAMLYLHQLDLIEEEKRSEEARPKPKWNGNGGNRWNGKGKRK